MDNVRQQIIDRLKQANNVLVTVSNNPSVDQLAACIGLTLMLNKLGKHGTAVFSGKVPSTIEFLKPEATIEKNTDSLRDFIIALDKSKADKLRYKVEDKVVKIFITPYKTSISDKDLDFSQGDFNVDAVVALGVHQQQDLDQAITSHGRILHDATVISVNNTQANNLGSLNWIDTSASSLSELVAQLDGQIGNGVLDAQISTALLTGIVAETERFSNNKTSSQTMSVSAKLMSAGANQQLVATKLAPPPPAPPAPKSPAASQGSKSGSKSAAASPQPPKPQDGTIKIDHEDKPPESRSASPEQTEEESQIHIDEEGTIHVDDQPLPPSPPQSSGSSSNDANVSGGSPIMTQPPTWDSKLTANSDPDSFEQGREPSADPLSLPTVEPPLLNRDDGMPQSSQPNPAATDPSLADARSAVENAAASSVQPLEPRTDLNAQPVFDNLQPSGSQSISEDTNPIPNPPVPPAISSLPNHNISAPSPAEESANTLNMPMPPPSAGQLGNPGQPGYDEDVPSGAPQANSTNFPGSPTPPPVPPPITPPVF